MVARKDDADFVDEVEAPGFVGGLVLLWRLLLTRLLFSFARVVIGARERRWAGADKPFAERPWVASLAIVALLGGVVGGILLAPAGQPRLLAAAAGAASLLWAPLRLLLMRLSAPRPLTNARAITGAWAVGLLAYGIGLTPGLRLAAWVISGGITWFALQRLGESRREATLLTGVAWGTQAGVVVLSWLARSAYVAIFATRG